MCIRDRSPEEARAVWAAAIDAEDLFGGPVDVEWAIERGEATGAVVGYCLLYTSRCV